jgi:hypothetical protein
MNSFTARYPGSPSDFQRADNSTPFWAFVYDLPNGKQVWREFTREGLLDHLTLIALSRHYVALTINKTTRPVQLYIRQILKRVIDSDTLFDSEVWAVQAAWRDWWQRYGESVRIASVTTPMKTQ